MEIISSLLTLLGIPRCNLGQVSEIVTFHFQIEHLAIRSACITNEMFLQKLLKTICKWLRFSVM